MGTMRYNSAELPDIETVWTDKETYKYAYIIAELSTYYLYLTPSACTGTTRSLRYPGSATCYGLESYGWSEKNYRVSGGGVITQTVVWCSHDLYTDDGTFSMAASDPVPVLPSLTPDEATKWYLVGQAVRKLLVGVQREQWETLFEGTVETEYEPGAPNAFRSRAKYENIGFPFNDGDSVRLIVNGVSTILPVTFEPYGIAKYTARFGNAYLAETDSDGDADTGYDYYVIWYPESSFAGVTNSEVWFHSRNPGTYTIKIERLVAS